MRCLSPAVAVLDTLWLAGNKREERGGGKHKETVNEVILELVRDGVFLFYSVDGSEGKGDAEERLFWKLFSDPINVVCQALG